MITAILGITLLVAWIWVFVSDRDAWPFSSYPMFSQSVPVELVNVFRIRVVDSAGEEKWWSPPASQIARDFDRGFRESMKRSVTNGSTDSNQYALRFFTRWNQEEEISAIHVVGRTALADQVILRIPVSETKSDG